jgi:hypothetical protein
MLSIWLPSHFHLQIGLTIVLFVLQLGELVKKLEQELEESKKELTEKQVQYKKCVSTVSELEKTIKTYGSEREGRLKGLEIKIKSLKSEMQSMSKQLKVGFLTLFSPQGICICPLHYYFLSVNIFNKRFLFYYFIVNF